MTILLLQAIIGDYAQWGIAGAIVFLVVVFLLFLLKSLPSWKDVKLAEISVREKEAESRAAQATSFGQLSGALSSISEVLNNVAVEQRHSVEKVRILQRVNADTSERTEAKIDSIIEKAEDVFSKLESLKECVVNHTGRINALEKQGGR